MADVVFRDELPDLIRDTLKDVLLLPVEFRSWVPSWVESVGIQTPRSNVIGAYTTGTTADDLGAPVHGRPVMVRTGATPYHFIQLTYDDVYGKYASSQVWFAQQNSAAVITDTNTSYVHAQRTQIQRFTIPGFKAFYDAGLRPQVYVVASMAPSSTGFTCFARAAIVESSPGDTGDMPAAGSEIATGGEITRTGSTTRAFVESGWADMTFSSAPTKTTGHVVYQFKSSAGTSAYTDTSYALRWVLDPPQP